ncbi:MAG: hypothetical protein K8S54_18740 [Spirochaetia bacterium]|nr:hypothetical protein [Spirochaetia bacterium]
MRNLNPGSHLFTSKILKTVFAAFVTLGGVSSLLADEFNPYSVMPAECKNGQFRCGFLPPTPDEMRSLPTSDASYFRNRGLPPFVDLAPELPPVGFQGEQGSCLGWSLAYTIRSYQERKASGWTYDSPVSGGAGDHVLSPAFLYNQINGGRDQGSDPVVALKFLVKRGVSTWKRMPYHLTDYKAQPAPEAINEALQFRAGGFKSINAQSVESIKAELAAGRPVMMGLLIYENFYKLNKDINVYENFRGKFYGGHAITIIGYDDRKSVNGTTGAFKIMNSWGKAWGDQGYGYITYKFLPVAATAAFVVEQRTQSTPPPEIPEKNLLPPREIAATRGLFQDRVEISWVHSDGAIAYEIQRLNSGSGRFDKIGYAVKPRFIDNAVQSGEMYRYRIIAIYRSGRSDAELSPVAEGFSRIPGAVAGFTLPRVLDVVFTGLGVAMRSMASEAAQDQRQAAPTAAQGNTIAMPQSRTSLSWNEVPGAEWYEIARFDAASKTFRPAGISREPGFSEIVVTDQDERIYTVRARSAYAIGPWSSPIRESRLKINGLDVSKGTERDRIKLKWSPIAGAEKYLVYAYDPDRRSYAAPAFVTSPQFEDTSDRAKSGAWVGYTVAPVILGNTAGFTSFVFGKSDPAMKRSAIAAPGNLRADSSSGSPVLQWDSVSNADKYFVFRKREQDADFEVYAEVPSNQFRDLDAKPGELLYYTVRSSAGMGESPDSNTAVTALEGKRKSAVIISRAVDATEAHNGKWKGSYWDGSTPVPVLVELSSNASTASARIQWGNRPFTLTGLNARGAQTMEIPGLRARIERGILICQFTDNTISPAPLELALEPAT